MDKQLWHTLAVVTAFNLAPSLTAAFGAMVGKAEQESPYCHGNWETDSYKMLL